MAIEKKIDIIVDVSDAVTDVNKLDTSMKALDKTTQSLGSSQQATRQNVLDNGGAMGLLNDATGGLAMTFKDAVEASSLFGKQSKIGIATQKAYTFVMGTSTGAMKAFKLALIGTGIGALVVGVGLLIANFDKVKKAVMSFIPALEIVGDFIGKIVDAVTDFVGITSDATRALDEFERKSKEALDKSTMYTELNAYKHDEYTNRKYKANQDYYKKSLELVEMFRNGEIKSQEELDAFLKQAREKANYEIDQADADREAKRNEAKQKEIDEANAKAKQDAQLRQQERERIQKEAFDFAVKMAEMERTIAEEKRARNKQIAEEDEAEMFAQYDREIAALVKKAEKEKEIEQVLAQSKIDIQNSVINNVAGGIQLLKELAGQNKALQATAIIAENAVGIAKQIIATRAANALVTAKYAAIPGGVALATAERLANNISLGLGIASSAVATGKALSALGKGGGDGGGSSSGGGQAPSAPSFNLVGGTGINQIAQGLGQQQQPIQAYVVSGNVTSAQALDRNIVNTASVG